jgi:UDP-N-acetylmuramoyl-tripeptide--D-alanyl-D-alanine ligase
MTSMRDLTLSRLHEIAGGRLRLATLPPRHGEATLVREIVTDSREVRKGNAFWGLAGTRFDGAAFADEAFSRGAAGAVVGRYVQPPPGCWSLQVDDAQRALHTLARWNRRRMAGRVVAVTGSVGKTTTRQMVHAVLATRYDGTASPKNFNNHVGVPLSMLAIEPEHDFAVLELAASGAGEIGCLAELCEPQVGVITRIGDAHLGGFGSLDAVAEAKAELLAALPPDGSAVLPGDDPHLRRFAGRTRASVTWVGRALDNDVVATNVQSQNGALSFSVDGTRVTLGVWGRHHLAGALAAVAVGRIFGIDDAEIARGLSRFQPPPRRCQIHKVGGATIIDDTYNASPVAMKAALELLRDFDAPGRRIVVCGDMRELGEASGQLHEQLGERIVTVCGADLLLACGEQAHLVIAGARAAGMPRDSAVDCRHVEDVLARCPSELRPGDVMLVKGSRAMEMERLVDALSAAPVHCAA